MADTSPREPASRSEREPDMSPARTDSKNTTGLGRLWQKGRGFSEGGTLLALIGMVAVIGIFHPRFVELDSLLDVARQASLYGILALGMVYLLSMREIDLSVGSLYAVTVIVAALLMEQGMNPWVAGAGAVIVGIVLGAINGILGVVLGVNTLIITLGTLSAYRGLTLILTDAAPIYGLPTKSSFFTVLGGDLLGVPTSIWALVLLAVLLTLLYRRTRFGFMLRAIGSNEQAARLNGFPVERIRILALMLMGALCALSGLLTLAYFGSADPNLGIGWEFLAIAAAVIGGTSLAGGSGTVLGAMLGALVLSVISSGTVQFGVSANWSQFVTGSVLIGAVALDALVRRRRAARAAAARGL
jgi:ribose transport system permease protein